MKVLILISAALTTVVLASPLTEEIDGKLSTFDGAPPPGCHWEGTAPICAGSCTTGYIEKDRGPCGDGACCVSGVKTLCCAPKGGPRKTKKKKKTKHTDDD